MVKNDLRRSLTLFYFIAASLYHVSYLRYAGLLFGSVPPIINQGTLQIVEGGYPFMSIRMDEANAIKDVGRLVWLAKTECCLVERQGLVVLPQEKMALGVGEIIDGALLWGECRQLWDYGV